MGSLKWHERIYAGIENVILRYLVPRDRPGPIWRWVFKAPILLYRAGLGWVVGKRVLLLHTTGRKTGKHRRTPLEYHYVPEDDTYILIAGWRGKTDWYRNARANDRVHVQVGRRAFDAVAEPLTDDEVAELLAEIVRRHPQSLKMFARWSDEPVDGSTAGMRKLAPNFPSLRLRPTRI
jgi:deazaflavin-dependent oxidoreductase (nitroreductase family)